MIDTSLQVDGGRLQINVADLDLEIVERYAQVEGLDSEKVPQSIQITT
jgi:hypothetical protein